MIKTSFTLLILLTFPFYSYGQWFIQNTGTIEHLRGVDFVDSLVGVAVGYNGTIIKTIDGGLTWSDIPSPNSELYWKIHFVNDSVGWISGKSGSVLFSDDQGETWEMRNAGIVEDIVFSYFVNDSTGWVIGADGAFYHTINQGQTWVDKSINEIDYYSSMIFLNDSTGLLVGDNVLYRTNNSGVVWEDISFTSSYITDVCFVDEQTGWLCGEDGLIYKTEDAGLNWSPQESNINEWLHDLYFFNSNEGWAVGRHGKIIYTIDGGNNWISYDNPVASNHHIISVDFTDENHGWACASLGTIIKYTQDTTLALSDFISEEITIYPNPIIDKANITLPEFSEVEAIGVYDIHGRNLGSEFLKKETNNRYTFLRKALTSGIYFIAFRAQDRAGTVKVIIK